MNKKIIIVIVAIVIVFAVVGVVLLIIQSQGNNSTTGTTTTGTLPPASTSTPPLATPTSTTITLGTSQGSVTVNNFYQNAQTITPDQQAVIIQNTGDYVITYSVPDSSFSIAILSTPLEAARQAAESAFLSELGISEQDACKLTVTEGVPISVSDEYPGEIFPLSFCGGPPTL